MARKGERKETTTKKPLVVKRDNSQKMKKNVSVSPLQKKKKDVVVSSQPQEKKKNVSVSVSQSQKKTKPSFELNSKKKRKETREKEKEKEEEEEEEDLLDVDEEEEEDLLDGDEDEEEEEEDLLDSDDDDEEDLLDSDEDEEEEEEDLLDSDDDDEEQDLDEEDKIFLQRNEKKENRKRNVLYVGRIPHGFYENQMKAFFSQFGAISRLRVSRNKKTGKSKHYGFIEFEDEEVALIVAETMDGHLMFNHILRVKVMDPEKVHSRLFVGANKTFKPSNSTKKHMIRHNKKRESKVHDKLSKRLQKKDLLRKEKLQKMGVEYEFPGYAASVQQKPKRTKF